MKSVKFDISKENLWIKNQFNKDLVSYDDFLTVLEDLIFENEQLKDEIKEIKTVREPDPHDEYMDWVLENE